MAERSTWTHGSAIAILCGGMALSGCMNPLANKQDGDVEATRARALATQSALAEIQLVETNGERSPLIDTLLARQSAIPPGSPFAEVSRAVMATNAGMANADLRAARLRAEAKSKNWLPQIGPAISLTSLGDLVAQLVIEQVVFDNGRRKAERDFAAHDVEAAAVSLSQDSNARVGTALNLYVNAQRAREEARVASVARERMSRFVNIIQQRVDGGVSNMADLSVARSKLHELDAERARALEAEATALAELEAMAQRSMSDINGLAQMGATAQGLRPLNVVKAQAEGDRGVAQAKLDRAAMLPGVAINGAVGEGGLDATLNTTTDQLIGLGTGSALKAIQASQDAARRSVLQAQEDNRRVVHRLEQKRAALQRQQAESAALVADARQTYDLFYRQFENSGRPIMDVVNIYENAMRLERDAVRLRYELALIEVEIASLYGTLVSGADV